MAGIPASTGWEADHWKEWFELLLDLGMGHLKALETDRAGAVGHVHESRKILKRIRAGTRLVREGANRESLRTLRFTCRDAGRLLSASRDGSVRLQTFQSQLKGVKGLDEDLVEVMTQALAAAAKKGEKKSQDRGARALRLLQKAALPPKHWSDMGPLAVQRGLRRMLKRARIDFLDVSDGRSDEFHELRKRVKDLYYAVGALPAKDEKGLKSSLITLKALSDTLGEENDITVLLLWFKEMGFSRKKYGSLWKPFEKRHAVLQERVMKEGKVLEHLADEPLFKKKRLGL